MKSQQPQSFVWYCKHGKKIKSSECSDCFKEFITEREIRVRADVLKMVYEKAYKLDWSEDAFVIWLEAELKKVEGKHGNKV